MAARDPFRTIIPVIGKLLARLRGPRFECGDCARQAHCGLPPHDDCLHRLEQIARDGDRPRPKPIHTAAWPS